MQRVDASLLVVIQQLTLEASLAILFLDLVDL